MRDFGWVRYVVQRGTAPPVDAAGFLRDPAHDSIIREHFGVSEVQELLAKPVVVLLGEPGSGKTTVLSESLKPRDGSLHKLIDVGTCTSSEDLRKTAFDSDTIREWKQDPDRTLTLVLDGLDESMDRVATAARVIAQELDDLPRDRLRLRIGCRTSEWSQYLEGRLSEQWPGAMTGAVVELCPLRREDARLAAKVAAIDPTGFFERLSAAHALPLAASPVTLELLLKLAASETGLPSTRSEAYRSGLLQLAREPNAARKETTADYSPADLVEAAGLAATLLLLGRKAAITREAETANDDAFSIDDLTAGWAKPDGKKRILHATRTALFFGRRPGAVGFAHHTFAEFLAAQYLRSLRLEATKIEQLLTETTPDGRRVVPTLRGVAAWLAATDADWLKTFVNNEPQTALMGDLSAQSPEARKGVVDVLLARLDQAAYFPWRQLGQLHFRSLAHPALVDQLRPTITDKTRSPPARQAAMILALQCSVTDLMPPIASVALDPTEPMTMRTTAANIVSSSDHEAAKRELRSLAAGTPEDTDDELKGHALSALWPTHLTAKDLIPLLAPVKRRSLLGSYKRFLWSDLAETIKPNQLPLFLDWAEPILLDEKAEDGREPAAREVYDLAWDHADDPEIRARIARIALGRAKAHRPVFPRGSRALPDLITNAERRRKAFRESIPHLPESIPFQLVRGDSALLRPQDLEYWLSELPKLDDNDQLNLSRALHRAYDPRERAQIEMFLRALHLEPIKKIFLELLPVEIKSERADKMRAAYAEDLHHDQEIARLEREQKVHDPVAKTLQWLPKAREGDPEAWSQLCYHLSHDERGFETTLDDLSAVPGWETLRPEEKSAIMEGARRRLARGAVGAAWKLDDKYTYGHMAEYKALRLLHDHDPNSLNVIPTESWKHAAAFLIHWPTGGDGYDAQLDLIKRATPHAEEEIGELLRGGLTRANDEAPHWLSRISWTDKLVTVALETIRNIGSAKVVAQTLTVVGRHDTKRAVEAALSFQSERKPEGGPERQRALGALRALVRLGQEWGKCWDIMAQDPEFGTHAIEELVRGERMTDGDPIGELPPAQLEQLYQLLHERYPPNEDPNPEGAHFVGFREDAGRLRDSVLQRIVELATPEAVHAVVHLARKLPTTGIKAALQDAKERALVADWNPITPTQFRTLTENRHHRLVRNRVELREAVRASLVRFQDRLTGETPAAADLFNEIRTGPGQSRPDLEPKTEDSITDRLKRHLDDDLVASGIIANREVRTRRVERTDVHIDALTPADAQGRHNKLTCVLEIKGCWNTGTKSSIRTQLADRYLKDTGVEDGFLVVFCFHRSRWRDGDNRRRSWHRDADIEGLRQELEAEAKKVATDNLSIEIFVFDAFLNA